MYLLLCVLFLLGPDAQASVAKYLARYPLTGSSKVKLVLEKNDLRGYHIKAVLRTDNPAKQSFEVLFDAEGTVYLILPLYSEYTFLFF